MAFIAKTAFEPAVTNLRNNDVQNVAGQFVTVSDDTAAAADCSAGLLVTQYALLDSEAYSGAKNGNAWQFAVAADGTKGNPFIYAFNSYDVNEVSANGNTWRVGAKTLGLGLPAGITGTFTQIVEGEQYRFGSGNFSTLPGTAADKYCTIVNGLLVASSTAPSAGVGVYFEYLRKTQFTEGVYPGGDAYVLRARKA